MTPEEKAEADEAERIRLIAEKEAAEKAEAEAKAAAEAAKKLAEENEARWKKEEEERKKHENDVVHVTSSVYAQEAEDKVDAQDEGVGRRRKKKKAVQDKPVRTGKGKKKRRISMKKMINLY